TAFGLITFLTFVPMTKIVLGAVIAAAGAFMPSLSVDKLKGKLNLEHHKLKISWQGAPRIGLVAGGILLFGSSLFDGQQKASAWALEQTTEIKYLSYNNLDYARRLFASCKTGFFSRQTDSTISNIASKLSDDSYGTVNIEFAILIGKNRNIDI